MFFVFQECRPIHLRIQKGLFCQSKIPVEDLNRREVCLQKI